MIRVAVLALAAALAACTPAPQRVELTDIPLCAESELTGALEQAECQLDVSGQTLHVIFQPLAAGAAVGAVSIEVLGDDASVVQTMLEPDVAEYRAPTVQDIDGDGRADVLIPRETGNVNTSYGVWVFNGARGVFERVGAVSGVSVDRTADGLVAVPARSSAAAWEIAYFKLDEGGLHPVASVNVETPAGASMPSCTLIASPGLAELNITEAEARTRFCAEPASQVFAP